MDGNIIMDMACTWCGKNFDLYIGEYNRAMKNGRDYFFCSLSCAARYANEPRKLPLIAKVCPNCGKEFDTRRGPKGATFCSRSCASKGSVNDKRREAARKSGLANCGFVNSAEAVAAGLRTREGWKYTKLKTALKAIGESFTFEFPLETDLEFYVFDLVLHDRNLLVEFDGDCHRFTKQRNRDAIKDRAARKAGWQVMRILGDDSQLMPASIIRKIMNRAPLPITVNT